MSNNTIILNGCVEQFKAKNELTRGDSEIFDLFCVSQITKSYDLTFEDIDKSIVDNGNDGGIDSLIVLIDDVGIESIEDLDEINFSQKTHLDIIITQCKNEKSFKEGVIDKLITTFPELFNLEKSLDDLLIRFNPELVSRATIARDAWKKCAINGGKYKILFAYCSSAESIEINNVFKSKVDQLKGIAATHFSGALVEHINFSSSELLKLYQTHRNQRLQLLFKEAPLSTSYEEYGIGYVGTVKLNDYKEFVSDEDGSIRDDLFESNIRHFQGLVDVNKKIKHTVQTPDKNDFWWLNNGITIIADNPRQVGKTLSIDNVQIVNGLQTSYSIFNNHTAGKNDNRSVLVKVIINEDKETIDNIIASTNSQNPVSPALLRATDSIQRNIELFFGNRGYYYDRRKNYYKNQGKPAAKIFSIQTAAQSIEAIIYNNPFTARSQPTSLIKDDDNYDRIFNQNTSFMVYLNCCLILKAVNDHWGAIEPGIKVRVGNFKLHIARILASVLTAKPNYSLSDLECLSVDIVDQNKFNESLAILTNAIDNFQRERPETNLISMSKIRGFTEYFIDRLRRGANAPSLFG
jgi:hypothetical protein